MLTDQQRKLVEDNIGLVGFVLSKYYPKHVWDEDIFSVGEIGLLKATEKWDPERGKFSTYAPLMIRKEVSNYFRSTTCKKRNELRNRIENIYDEEGNSIIEDRVADDCDIENDTENKILNEKLYEVIGKLKPYYRTIITKVYIEGKSHSQVGKEMGKSKQTICGSKVRALKRLRETLGDWHK